MSVQLIVYPQSYDGFGSVTTTATNEFASDGINFNTVNASTNQVVTLPNGTQEAIDFYNPTMAVNTWYRYYEGASGVNIAGNVLILSTSASAPQQGILQKLSNLTVGGVYNITIDIQLTVNSTNAFGVWIYSGNVLQSISPLPTVAGVVTLPFTANSTEDTIVITGNSTIAQFIRINSFSVTNAAPVPSGAIQLLEDGQVICDLYEDEDLPLTLSVDDFKNVAEKVQSYSKAFNLPSTKRNNKIFNAIFEVTRENDGLIFNPYKRTQCVLKQDGFILFEGYLRLLDVTDKEGEISYNVNLYSEVIALADTLQDRAFRDLDFTEIEHEYNRTQIKRSWNDGGTGITYTNPSTSGFRDAYSTVKYPFVDWNHQILVGGSSGSGNSATVGNPELPTLETAFRPFISIKYLVDRIFEATDFTYESTFFDTTDFKKLFMDFNWGADNAPVVFNTSSTITRNSQQILNTSFATLDFNSVTPPAELGYSLGIFTAVTDNQIYNISFDMIFNNTAGENLDVEWLISGVSSFVINVGINPTPDFYNYNGSFTATLNSGDTILCQAKSTGSTMYLEGGSNSIIATTSSDQTTSDTLLGTLRGELGQWDFLKGLITMFYLVTLVDEDTPNNILIEPYTDVFIPTATGGTTLANRGIQHDWTDKIDVSEIKLTPLTDLNRKTIFKFVEDDDDYSFNQYKKQVGGHLYGSKKFPLVPDDRFNILDGEEEIVVEPFAATLVKALMSQYPQFITPAIYAINNDVEEGFENSPRIMYNNGIKSTGASYYIPEQNGVVSSNETNFLQFSHLTEIPTSSATPSTTIDFHFGICQLLTGDAPTPNNLFNLYWLPYYSELYNPNTRTMTLKVNLSPADINTFKFNDRVFIKNRVFRVNKIDYKPNDLATVEFILIP